MKHAGANCPVGHSFYAMPSIRCDEDDQFTRVIKVNRFAIEVVRISARNKTAIISGRDAARAAAVLKRCGWRITVK